MYKDMTDIELALDELGNISNEYDVVLESYIEDNIATEGANLKAEITASKAKRAYRKAVSEAKKALKDKDTTRFKAAMKKCDESLSKYEKEIEEIGVMSNGNDAIFAFVVGDLKSFVMSASGIILVVASHVNNKRLFLKSSQLDTESKEYKENKETALKTIKTANNANIALQASYSLTKAYNSIKALINLIQKFRNNDHYEFSDFNVIINLAKTTIKKLRAEFKIMESEGLKALAEISTSESRESFNINNIINDINIAVESVVDNDQYEIVSEAIENVLDELYLSQAMEGINKDMTNALNGLDKEYTTAINAMNLAINRKDKDAAIEYLSRARNALQKVDNESKKILSNGSTTWETIKSYGKYISLFGTSIATIAGGKKFGKMASNNIHETSMRNLISRFVVDLGIAGSITSTVATLNDIIDLKVGREDFTEADKKTKANMVLRASRGIIKGAYQYLDKCDEQIDALKDEE